jgi:ureidoglycolate dehydrogenase (NAD+)
VLNIRLFMFLSVDTLLTFCAEALCRSGLSGADSKIAAEALVLTDTWGVHTHGTKNLREYIRRIRAGGIRAQAKPYIDREGPACAMVDGNGALGMVASTYAMRVAIEKARRSGIGYAGLRNSCHFGAAGLYSALAANEGLIGIGMSNDTPTVAVPGSRGPVLGSNPFSYAIPVKDAPPILLDIATSTVAGGKVFTAAAHGKSVPEGWIIDENGMPTTDPKLFPSRATLTPMSAHKGYGIALLIETLSAIMTGAAIAQHVLSWSFSDPALSTNHGAAFIAINIAAMSDPVMFNQRLAQTISEIRSAPRAAGVERIFLPGELEWERRAQALLHGLELPQEILESLKTLADELGIPFVI